MNVRVLYIDLFCGAGGTSTGVELARVDGEKCAKVIACVNHDANAIASHAANHPETLHFMEDIRTLELSPLVAHVKKMKAMYPDALVSLWASLECTNFSKAKGGKPRDADSRTLAEHLFRYIKVLKPDYLQVENVIEFMSWGELDKNGKPAPVGKGSLYLRWVRNVCGFGYDFDYRLLNAADYGAYTSRKRFFGIFAKHGLPIVFPEQTHTKTVEKQNPPLFFSFPVLKKWQPVKDVLDFSDEGESIFTRKKPLSDKTLERIYAGLVKFVAGGKDKWLLKYNSTNGVTGKHIPPSIDEPCPVVSCQNRLAIVQTCFLSKFYSGHPESKNFSIDEPAHTVTGIDHHALVSTKFLGVYCGGKGNQHNSIHGIDKPSPTVTVFDRISVVNPCFLMNPQFYSAGGSIDKPCFTLIARMDKMPPYIVKTKNGEFAIEVYENDTETTRKIKEFMSIYGIADIKMRMLKIKELKRIMGFPENYVLIGTQAEQKKYIGNAVEVGIARAWVECLCDKLMNLNKLEKVI